MEQLLSELKKLITETRKNSQEKPFLSEFEKGWNEGGNDVIDNLERVLKEFS